MAAESFSGNPYTETYLEDGSFYRTFSSHVPEDELIWHRDKHNRKIVILDSSEWKLQLENELPMVLVENSTVEIPAYHYHRLIKGHGDLVLHIYEDKE